jgi:hypothetical protein
MSVIAEADQPHQCQPPETRPVLPIVQLSEAHPLMCVHYVELEAVAAAKEAPQDTFYDMRGMVLKLVEGDDGQCLETSVDVGIEELRRKVMDAVTATTELDDDDDDVRAAAAELRRQLPWLEAAPDLITLIGGLASAPLTYAITFTCQKGCSPWMRTHPHPGPPCCPGE